MIFIGIFTIIYNFKVGLIRLLLFNGLTYGKFNRYDALGIGLIVYLLLFPYEIYNLGFWFVLGFYLKKMIDDKYLSYFINCLIQGIFLNRINFVLGLLYKYLVYVYGLMYITAWIILIFKIDLLFILSFIDLLLKIIDKFSINGNPLGIGLIFVLLLYKHKKIMIVTFVLMMKLALIHPLGEITFINVGQGDSILIRLPFNQGNYLIDTGKESSYKYLKNYLDAKGIKRLDYLFITHQDSDHSGNVNNLIRDYKVDNVITKKFDKIVDKICIINFNRETYDNDNDNSLIMLIDYNNLKFLFMGDASKKVERDLIDKYDFKDVDVLKAGHHGSNTSSDKLFVKEVMPLLTVFSAGKNNRYNHPHKEVLELFDNEGLAYMQTDISGDISIFILDKIKFFYTSDKRIGIIYA